MSEVKTTSPPIVWKPLFKYDLSKLKTDFKIADFERAASSAHIRDIVKSILSNKFYDPVVRVVKAAKPWVVIDGQHRLQALYLAHKEHGLKTYNIMVAIYEEEFARTVFRRLNMGKPLQTRDHSRALDDKKTPFFIELQPWLAHDRTPAKGPYTEMLHALHYAKGAKTIVKVRELDDVIAAITKSDIEIMKRFCEATKIHSPVVTRALIFRASIYRNVFRIGYDNHYNVEQFLKLMTAATEDKKVVESSEGRTRQALLITYKILVDKVIPRMK